MSNYSSQRNSIQKKEIKKKLFKLQGGKKKKVKCFFCKCQLEFHNATIDHLVPLSKNGSWKLSNLKLACRSCNSAKGDSDWRIFLSRFENLYREEGIESLFNQIEYSQEGM